MHTCFVTDVSSCYLWQHQDVLSNCSVTAHDVLFPESRHEFSKEQMLLLYPYNSLFLTTPRGLDLKVSAAISIMISAAVVRGLNMLCSHSGHNGNNGCESRL